MDAESSRMVEWTNANPAPIDLVLQARVEEYDPESGRLRQACVVPRQWANPLGDVAGGSLCQLLDASASKAGSLASRFELAMITLDLRAEFHRPVKPGPVTAVGEVVKLGRSTAFLAAEVFGPDGNLALSGRLTAKVVALPPGFGPFAE